METIYERVGALDVHKAQVTACVRFPMTAGGASRSWRSSRLAGRLPRDAGRDGSHRPRPQDRYL